MFENLKNWRHVIRAANVEISDSIDWLEKSASENVSRAYEILGAKPGPGIDIDVHPSATEMNGTWCLVGLTKAGTAFIAKFWPSLIRSNHQLAAFKRQAEEWGLKYHVIVKFESLESD
jgi:hypothetical protein